jgi:hypothetical protein
MKILERKFYYSGCPLAADACVERLLNIDRTTIIIYKNKLKARPCTSHELSIKRHNFMGW